MNVVLPLPLAPESLRIAPELSSKVTFRSEEHTSELVKNTLLELNKKGTTLVLTSHDSIFDDVKPDIDFNLETGVLS